MKKEEEKKKEEKDKIKQKDESNIIKISRKNN